MKKIFFSVLFSVIFLNVVYKSIIYYKSTKVTGTVIEIYSKVQKVTSRNGFSYQLKIAPVIRYQLKNEQQAFTKIFWVTYNTLAVDEKVTLLIDENTNEITINTIYYFWFTEKNLFVGLSTVLIVSIILGNVLPTRKMKIRTWK